MIYVQRRAGWSVSIILLIIFLLIPQTSSSSSKHQVKKTPKVQSVSTPTINIKEVRLDKDILSIKVKISQYIKDEAKYEISVKDTKCIVDTVFETCDMLDLNPYLVLAIMHVESEFNVRAKSRSGAQGLMQVKNSTKKDIEKRYKISAPNPTTRNIKVGSTYVAEIAKRYTNVDTVLTAYSKGPENVRRNNVAYINKVKNAYRQIASIK
jgi:soluble lytic murein transglycosylase-like protein